MSKAVVITGATGKQGGATINALLRANFNVTIVAVTRDPDSETAKALSRQSNSIKVIKGDLHDSNAILSDAREAAGQPIFGVLSVQTVCQTEELQGKALIDASIAASVQHFVYASVERRDASDPTYVPHFATKYRVEQYLINATAARPEGGMSWTVLQPGCFIDNFTAGPMAPVFASMWKVALPPTKPMQMIATTDTGRIAAAAFLEPQKYAGRVIALEGDELSFEQVAKVFKEKTGSELPCAPDAVGQDILEKSGDLALMWKWFLEVGNAVDIQALKKEFGGMMGFSEWLEMESGYEKK